MSRKFRIAAIISYLLIFIGGSMIAMPIFLILPFSLAYQTVLKWTIYSIFGLILLTSNIIYKNKKLLFFLNSLSFLLLVLAISVALTLFDSNFFNFPMFYVPLSLFIILYLISLILEFNDLRKNII